jgi:polyhydroxybutyrate depolymerase
MHQSRVFVLGPLAVAWFCACASTKTEKGSSGGSGGAGAGGTLGAGGVSAPGGVSGSSEATAAGTTSGAGTGNGAGMTNSAGAGGRSSGGQSTAGAGEAAGFGGAGLGGRAGGGGITNQAGQSGTAAAAGASLGGAAGIGGMAAAVTCPSTATAMPGETNESIMVGGMARTFVRHVPPGYTGKTPVPVVIDFHPLGGTGSSWKGSTNWGSVADKQGFIMIWPDGVGNSWNVGRCCSTAQSQNVDDVAFTKAIVATLEKEACIDPKRVYATGCSNGGGMAFKIACDAADVIAAVAPVDFDCVTGDTVNPSCANCAPARPISEMQFRGTSDAEVPYDGGSGPRGTMFPGAEENFSEWKGIDMCTGSAASLPDHSACQAYTSCAGGVEAILCSVQNGMHCGNYQSFDIVNIAWQMFQTQALP